MQHKQKHKNPNKENHAPIFQGTVLQRSTSCASASSRAATSARLALEPQRLGSGLQEAGGHAWRFFLSSVEGCGPIPLVLKGVWTWQQVPADPVKGVEERRGLCD